MDVLMPQLGETVAEGKILTWFKSVGDPVDQGDNLFEVETDKTAMDVPSTVGGVITEIRVAVGETVPVGAVVAVIGDRVAAVAAFSEKRTAMAVAAPAGPGRAGAVLAPSLLAPAAVRDESRPRVLYDPFREVRSPERNYGRARLPDGGATTPLARRLAAEAGIDLRSIRGSGPRGRIVAKDLHAHGGGATVAGEAFPQFHLRREASLTALLALIDKANAANPAVRISLRDCVVKALSRAFTEVPEANVRWADGQTQRLQSADIAVITDETTKVVRAANGKGLGAIAGELAAPADSSRSTIDTVSAICDARADTTPPLRSPHIASLAIGAVQPSTGSGSLTLCCDERVITGVVGERLLGACAAILERPMLLML